MWRRFLAIIGYVGVGLFVVGGTVLLVAYGRGYSYDFKAHRFLLNGLIILDSTPSGAEVAVNGKLIRPTTPYHSTIEAGDYDFTLIKDGFRSWSKHLSINASEVTFAQYVLLVPETLKTEQTKLNVKAADLVASPNHKHLAYLSTDPEANVWIFDTGNRTSRKIYTARATSTSPAETLKNLVWGSDNTHLLITSDFGGRSHLLVATTGSTTPVQDLTDSFNQDFNLPAIDPTSGNLLYFISSDGSLQRLNLNDQTISAVLAQNVSSFAFGGGRVFYVTTTKLGRSLLSLDRAGHSQELVQSLAQSSTYEILYAKANGKDLLMVTPADSTTATLYQDIFGAHPIAKAIGNNVTHLSRSPSGRYVVAYGQSDVITYDLEKSHRYDFKVGFKNIQSVSWYDEYHLLVVEGGIPNLIEFDGGNRTPLVGGLTDNAFPTADHTGIFGLAAAGSGSQVVFERLK